MRISTWRTAPEAAVALALAAGTVPAQPPEEEGDEATTMPVVPAEAFAHVEGG